MAVGGLMRRYIHIGTIIALLTITVLLGQNFGIVKLSDKFKPLVAPPQNEQPFPVYSLNDGFDSQDLGKIVPTNMAPTNNGQMVLTQIAYHSVDTIRDQAQQYDVAGTNKQQQNWERTVNSVGKKLEPKFGIGGPSENGKDQILSMELLALRQKARMKYASAVDMECSYEMQKNNINMEVSRPLSQNSTIGIGYKTETDSSNLQMTVHW